MSTIRRYPELTPAARNIIAVYDQTPGSSGPYANPSSLCAVLEYSKRLSPAELDSLIADLHV